MYHRTDCALERPQNSIGGKYVELCVIVSNHRDSRGSVRIYRTCGNGSLDCTDLICHIPDPVCGLADYASARLRLSSGQNKKSRSFERLFLRVAASGFSNFRM